MNTSPKSERIPSQVQKSQVKTNKPKIKTGVKMYGKTEVLSQVLGQVHPQSMHVDVLLTDHSSKNSKVHIQYVYMCTGGFKFPHQPCVC